MDCSCSGQEAGPLGETGTVITAWAKSVNAAGGINGHPVQVFVKDDGGNPATGLQNIKELVQSDHVMAIVGESSLVDTNWGSYVAAKGIPVVGGFGIETTFLTNPDFYPSSSEIAGSIAGDVQLAKQAGLKKIGFVYCAEAPVCAQLVPIGEGLAKLFGIGTYSAKISATAPSYTAPCLAAKSAGVDAIYLADNGQVDQRFVDGCAQQGFKPTEVNSTSEAIPAWLKDSNLNGTVLAGIDANTYDSSTPAIAKFDAAMQKYAPGVLGSGESYNVIFPWAGGKLFEAAAKAGHLTPSSTPAQVKSALYKLKNETLGGLAPPLTFTPNRPDFVPCYFSLKISGGKFISTNGDKSTCLSAAQAKQIGAALAKG